jgi:GNAT superfamily N-acetyltransferase
MRMRPRASSRACHAIRFLSFVLARPAEHSNRQGKGLGAGLLLDALGRTLQVADVIGVRALAVHAKDDSVSAFYRHFGFTPSPTDPRHLFMIIKDIRQAAGLET